MTYTIGGSLITKIDKVHFFILMGCISITAACVYMTLTPPIGDSLELTPTTVIQRETNLVELEEIRVSGMDA